MQVKTLKPHGNGYGAKFWKDKGDTYDLPEVQAKPLIAAKLIAEAKTEAQSSTSGAKAGGGADGAKG
ncbi:MAG: hypothetical protein APF82_00990 [Sphingomonadales bacterium BRH_c42]|nr:MAG: hypothetical protein APF82_00990 [Sphingomonadales bacterium BRH_c42]